MVGKMNMKIVVGMKQKIIPVVDIKLDELNLSKKRLNISICIVSAVIRSFLVEINVLTAFYVLSDEQEHTLTTNFRYRRLGDLNLELATLCACAGGEQQTIIKIVIHFL